MPHDHNKQYLPNSEFKEFISTENDVAKKYGKIVRAMLLSNREYQHRFDKLNTKYKMKEPPLSGRIFRGYIVVRNIGKKSEYETWMPDHVFEEIYSKDGTSGSNYKRVI
jgi:hypothetical protein